MVHEYDKQNRLVREESGASCIRLVQSRRIDFGRPIIMVGKENPPFLSSRRLVVLGVIYTHTQILNRG